MYPSLSDPAKRSVIKEVGDATFKKCRGFYVGHGSGMVTLKYEDNSEVPCFLTPGYHPRQIIGILAYEDESIDSEDSQQEGPQHIEIFY